MPASPMRMLTPYANQAKAEGVRVYHLNIGDPDIKSPPQMLRVLNKWTSNPVPYGQSQGNQELISSFLKYYYGLGYKFLKPENIQVTAGGSEAISMAFFSVANAGDEILVFEPFYANYNGFAAVNSVNLVPVPTSISDGFHLPDRKTIEKYISGKTRAIILCNPNNPTGTVYSQKEVEILISIARDRNLYFMSDEVYREFIYDGRKHVSVLDYMKANPDRVILVDSLSKRFSVCGIRIGVLVSLNMNLMAGALRIAQGRLSSGYVDQKIAERMDKVPTGYLNNVRSEYDRRRIILYRALKSIPGIKVPKPEGAFYTIVGLPVDNAEDFCKWLLTDFRDKNETVMLAPASGFYATPGAGNNEVRIAYVLNGKSLRRSVEILRKALEKFRKI